MNKLKSILDEINQYHKDNDNLECEFSYIGLDKVVFTGAPFITLPAMGKITIIFEEPTYFNFNLYGENSFFYTDEDKNFIDIISNKDEIAKLIRRNVDKDEYVFKINLNNDQIVIASTNLKAEITEAE